MARTTQYPVAVVVFITAEGRDPRDAINVAEQGLHALLAQHSDNGQLVVPNRGGNRMVLLGTVAELGRAQSGGALRIVASTAAFPS